MRFLFGDYALDTARRELSRGGEQMTLEPQVFDLLIYLLQSRERVVSKDNLLASVWDGRIVSDATLDSRIAAARRAIGDSGGTQTLIRTFARKGVRFVGEVRTEAKPVAFAPGMSGGIGDCSTPPRGARSLPPLSIVVLPFTNLSNDPKQDYFADGITDDLTTDLSRIADSFVISRNTAFTYRNKSIDTKQIGRELGVRYALEGSVRRLGNHIRVNAQLIDSKTGRHLWAERFDGEIGDLFVVQDEITGRIAAALNRELIAAEAESPCDQPDALDYILRGRAVLSKPASRGNYADAISFFENALVLDPHCVGAQSWLATALVDRSHDIMTGSDAADVERAEVLIGQALAASPRNTQAHYAKGQMLRRQRRSEEAIPEFEMVLAFNRNSGRAMEALSWCKLLTGSMEESIPLAHQAVRLGNRDPLIAQCYFRIGTERLLQSRTDEAILWLQRARTANPELPYTSSRIASAYALRGEIERAAAELVQAQSLSGDRRFSSIAQLKVAQYWGVPKIRALYEATYFAGLRKAGVPEE